MCHKAVQVIMMLHPSSDLYLPEQNLPCYLSNRSPLLSHFLSLLFVCFKTHFGGSSLSKAIVCFPYDIFFMGSEEETEFG